MKIAVLNGSPKGMTSVTMQYVLFLQKKHPQHEWSILNVCQDINRLEEDQHGFDEVVRTIESSDVVFWATPVYVLLIPGPYKRFIELVAERSAQGAFGGKYAASLTTSVRFFDHTAHAYLHAICDDLGMHYVGAYSAEMYDLVKEEEQKRATFFWEDVLRAATQRRPTQRSFAPLGSGGGLCYTPGNVEKKLSLGGRKALVLADADRAGSNVHSMVRHFCECFAEPVEVIQLHEMKIRGGCLGCIHCSFDNRCVYGDNDGVRSVYGKMMAADVIIHAGTVKDRFFSARWKTLLDRGFVNNHVPALAGKQVGYLVSGPLSELSTLREVLEAATEMGQVNLIGIISDECQDSPALDRLLEGFASRAKACIDAGYIRPITFLGKGGRKVLRDEIWASLRFAFPMDHRYYKQHGLYDFPRRSLRTNITEAFLGLLLKIPSFRKEFQKRMKEGMIEPLVKVVEKA